MKVLLVDDDYYVIDGLKSMIAWSDLGVDEVLTAQDGEEALAHYRNGRPDVLVTDVFMPMMDGLELIKCIRESDPGLPVVILSGYDEFSYAKEAIHLNVAQYILKPAAFSDIELVLRDIIREKTRADRKEQYFNGLRSQFERSLPVVREQFLFDMLTIGVKERDLSDNKRQFLRLDERMFRGGAVLSLLLHRDGSGNGKTGKESDWQLYKFAAWNIAQEIVDNAGDGYVLRYMEDRLPIFLYGSSAEIPAKADRLADELIGSIGSYLELSVSVGIGRWYESFTSYPLSHKESKDALERFEYEGYQKAFRIEESKDSASAAGEPYPLEPVRQLSEALLRGEREKADRCWKDISTALFYERPYSLNYVKALCISVINGYILHSIEQDPAGAEPSPWGESLQDIQAAQTKIVLAELMTRIFARILELHEAKHNTGRQQFYVQYVKKMVAEHYRDELSFPRIAEELRLTRNYLSSLFKRMTGESFSSYVTLYRIEKAKELMRSRRYMIYEVSEMVGYSDPAYFSKVFKTATGVSPTDYVLRENA